MSVFKPLIGEHGYLALLEYIKTHGQARNDRTGIGTLSHFGAQIRFDLASTFPLFTTKKVHFKSVAHELLWFLRGDTHINYLHAHGVSIWDEWADAATCARFGMPMGELGKIYGHQWRNFGGTLGKQDGIDQITRLIDGIKQNPYGRRHIVTGWNPADIDSVALPPCHTLFQFFVDGDRLSCQLYQRSADLFLGVPFNVASYALLTYMVAKVCNLHAHEFIWTGGDCHIYTNHLSQVDTQIKRDILPAPTLSIADKDDIFAFDYQDFTLHNYQHHSAIKAPVAV